MFLKTYKNVEIVIVIQKFDYNNCKFVYWLYDTYLLLAADLQKNKK